MAERGLNLKGGKERGSCGNIAPQTLLLIESKAFDGASLYLLDPFPLPHPGASSSVRAGDYETEGEWLDSESDGIVLAAEAICTASYNRKRKFLSRKNEVRQD